MNILKSMQAFLETCPDIELVHLERTDETTSDNYAVGLAGNSIVKRDIQGNKTYQYLFVFYVRDYSCSDDEREDTYDVLQNISDWIEDQDENENYPTLPTGCKADGMEVSNTLLLNIDGDGDAAIYQIQLKLNYTKEM